MSLRILYVCTGNSCRSPMAEALTKMLFPEVIAASAGVSPEKSINQNTVQVLKEIGIDASHHQPVSVEKYFPGEQIDVVICLSSKAYQYCKQHMTRSGRIIFWDVEDPMEAKGDQQAILSKYREVLMTLRKLIEVFFRDRFVEP